MEATLEEPEQPALSPASTEVASENGVNATEPVADTSLETEKTTTEVSG
ncbi:hypothetical protein K9N68_17795 [Kovacikia minuta CCNUW1]|nr:hypothetical protein [Kovacikia minuta]UBF23630.1 hypothetical protein K9N68_17795 [Kovacikia minuta CCNUW1]